MSSILITGANGFVGSHLTRELLGRGYKVIATHRPGSDLSSLGELPGNAQLLDMDVTNKDRVNELISDFKPDYIFHLAGHASTPFSFKEPLTTLDTNVGGTINIFDVLKKRKQETSYNPATYVILSQEAFGIVYPNEVPIDESQPYRPKSPYGISKALMHLNGVQFSNAYKLNIVLLRPFTHAGPQQKLGFLFSDWASQIAEIEWGKKEPIIRVGNLEPIRDYLHVKDVVRAYVEVIGKGNPGEVYNICSGIKTPVRRVLEEMISQSTLSDEISIEQDPEKMRPSETPLFVGSYEKFNKLTGWIPKYDLEDIIRDTLNYWREKIKDKP